MSKLIRAWTLMIAGAALAFGATLPAAAADEKLIGCAARSKRSKATS